MINQPIEERVEKLINEYNLTTSSKVAIDPFELAKKLNIDVDAVELDDTVSGFLAIRDGEKKLGYNKSHPVNRQRFTVAHELGHYFLHAKKNPLFIDKVYQQYNRNSKSSTGELLQEREANNFAAALLMPQKLVKECYENAVNNKGTLRIIRELAKKFEVSEHAMGLRLSHLGYLDYDTPF